MDDEHAASVPSLTIGRGWALYVGPVEAARLHRHNAAQLAWSGADMLSVAGAWGVLQARGHLLAADVPHELAAARSARLMFLDPTVLEHEQTNIAQEGVVALTPLQVDVLESELVRWQQGPSSADLTVTADRASNDRRWRLTLEWLDRALEGPARCEDAALAAGLSPSRFMHWFAQTSGLAFRAYVRWLRLQRAVRALSAGSNLTVAAHEAGFSDSAHLSRTFVATFGMRPANLRAVRIACTDQTRPPVLLRGLNLLHH